MSTNVNYSRTDDTVFNRDILSKVTVALVGAGALGNETFKNLGLLGVGSVLIVDPDVIEASNLTRSFVFRQSSCKYKAESLCQAGSELFPDTQWRFVLKEIADVGYQDLAECQLFFGCVDNDLARLEISIIAKKLRIPYVDAGLGGSDYWRGRVSLFPIDGACFGCKLMPARRRQLLQAFDAGNRSCWTDSRSKIMPSTPLMAGITAALQVESGLRSFVSPGLLGSFNQSMSIEIELDRVPRMNVTHALISAACPLHGSRTILRAATSEDQSARDLLQIHSGHKIELDWPICLKASCQNCQQIWSPNQRTGWMRRHAACPACRSKFFLELENIRSISAECEWATQPMSAIGLPQRHLYSIT